MDKHQGYEPKGAITVELSMAVALVLDSLLDRWAGSEDDSAVRIESDTEGHALSILACTLELELAELLESASEYDQMLETARRSLVEHLGQRKRGVNQSSES